MSITDVLSRISSIEQQVASLESGQATAGGTVTTAEANAAAGGSSSTGSSSATDFSDALAQAQVSDPTATAASATTATDPALSTGATTATDPTLATGATATTDAAGAFPTLAESALSTPTSTTTPALTGGVSAPYTTTAAAPYATTGTGTTAGVALPAGAGTMLTSDQQQFASTLSADTGLNPGVVSSWLLAEESGGAAQSRQAASNNDWLNIGYTGSGTFGAGDAIWTDPVSAANATAGWLKGENTIPGYGTASSGIQSILGTVGQTPQTQIAALQTSGWSGSGYPSLPELYASVTGS